MAPPRTTVRVRRQESAITFQVVGWGTMRQSLCLRRSAEQALAAGALCLRMDLRHCDYVDSTFLGTLLTLHRGAARRGGARFVLVSPSPGCQRIFEQLGVEDVFATEDGDDPGPGEWTEVVGEREEAQDFSHNVVQAHEELAGLGGTCGQAFGQVARQLRQDWESNRGQ